MSTKKVKDGTIAKQVITKSKKTSESTKKEVTKTRTGSKILSKTQEDDDDKIKKSTRTTPLVQSSSRRINKLAPNKKMVNSTRPATPPSSRVTKTQYFPSKKMYAHAIDTSKPVKMATKISRRETVKNTSPDTSSTMERPRTATLRRGSIVNNNIVGPDVPKAHARLNLKPPSPVDYEDDFDSYESDFEEYDSSGSASNLSSSSTTESSVELKSTLRRVGSASTDDEKKLDSGNFELPESRHRQMLDNIKESIEKENANLKSNLGSLSDEGFEEGKSLQFINFLGAQKKYQQRKSVQLRRKRGEELLSMIRLDSYSFTLFDLPPIPYDVFIKNFGRSNTVQVSIQTGEDDTSEEVQTDAITYKNKWTQFPPVFSKIEDDSDFWDIYKCNYLGVGGDGFNKTKKCVNETRLERFLEASGSLILNIQAEANVLIKTENTKSNIPFSKSCVVYNTRAVDAVKSLPIKNVYFCTTNTILTLHGNSSGDSRGSSMVCVWKLSNVEAPDKMLFSYGKITCCTYNPDSAYLIFGGLDDGTIVVWDTSERANNRNIGTDDVMYNPTYHTEIGHGHGTRIVAMHPVYGTKSETNPFTTHNSSEVCSLDEDGDVIVWSVIHKEENRGKVVEHQGLAHWGSVIVTMNTRISLRKLYPEIDDFICTDLALSQFDSSNLYISTSYGIIVHCLTTGGKTSVKKYLPGSHSRANCLEMCPFSSQFLLAGFDNGNINFYSRTIEKPLMVLSDKDTVEGKCKIETIQWSHNRPLIFYTKDITNTIHVWNLKVSDMFPTCSIPFKDKIVSIKLSPVTRKSGVFDTTYLLIACDNGKVYVHVLNEDHDQLSVEDFERDKIIFLNNVDRYV